jgi:hypothetical protein
MTKVDMIEVLDEDYSTSAVRDLARALRNDFAYEDLKVSYPKDTILDQIEETVAKRDLMEALDSILPGWDESPEDEKESEGSSESDDDKSEDDDSEDEDEED